MSPRTALLLIASSVCAKAAEMRRGTAEDEYRALRAISEEQPPAELGRENDARLNWAHARFIYLNERGLEFLEKHPKHPLRWDTLILLQYGRDFKINTLPDGKTRQLVAEIEGTAKWEQRYYPMLEELLTAADAGSNARNQALRQLVDYWCRSVRRGTPDKDAFAVEKARGYLENFRREFPRSGALASLYQSVAVMLDSIDPKQCFAFLREVRARHASDEFPDPDIRRRIAGRLRVLEGQAVPVEALWAKLSELDPALSDLTPYRGKVVLIAMMPVSWDGYTARLEQLYGRHHAAGFEIIQVAKRNSSVAAPPEQTQKNEMEKFVAKKNWPWRVVWDPGEHFANLANTWGQNTIPAYLLISRDGRIVNDRGGAFNYAAQIPRELAQPAVP